MTRSPLALALLALLPCALDAQTPEPGEWDADRALRLVRLAQDRRGEAATDSALLSYQADARGYVYFYLDRRDTGQRNLVKTDQVALEVFWEAPDRVKQRIVGWRDARSLPTNINYHIDHLTVVQENFGDEIRLGDGDEVRGVPHPAAPEAERFYHYRLVDSLTLRLPGATEPVRVYQLQVRPRDPSRPAFVGSVFLERRAGDLVRMDFTFTESSYVDPYLDRISISLDNGLWGGRFWLPNEQRVEIRRRLPVVDLPAGSVIRANMRVFGYRFNEPLPHGTFAGPPVVALPRVIRERFEFEDELFAEIEAEGLSPEMELDEIRRAAAAIVRERALGGVRGLRPTAASASELLRYNRAEGLALGLGAGWEPGIASRVSLRGGYAFGAEHAFGALAARHAGPAGSFEVGGYANAPRGVWPGPAASGLGNTLSALVAAEDFTDLHYASGAAASVGRPLGGGWSLEVAGTAESHRSAREGASFSLSGGEFRPVVPIDEADLYVGGGVTVRRRLAAEVTTGWSLEAVVTGGGTVSGDREGLGVQPRLEVGWRHARGDARLELEGTGALAAGEVLRQHLFLAGGRGTLPGYDFRAFGGDRLVLLEGTGSAPILGPWARARVLGSAGWTDVSSGRSADLAAWGAIPTGGLRVSLGAGLGLFYDIVRIDLARGFGDRSRWEIVLDASPAFWDFL